ncbi:MAG: hypothetical protein HC789_21610 [Microcoleus sp. CSU_2_2]|nr:hypothetical protein [Microcoleus sp. SU_5_3]NJS12782.1 hypothetical protein [Microcoleus sp. CSU_2_2]
MQETKDTSLFTEITAEESASVNGAHGYYRRRYVSRYRRGGCNNYSYSYNPYFDGRPVHGYVHNVSSRRYYYYD